MADNAVSSEKIKDDALTDDKIGEGSVQLSVEQRTGQPTRIEPGGTGSIDVTCNEGKVVVGGGFENEFRSQSSILSTTMQPIQLLLLSSSKEKRILEMFFGAETSWLLNATLDKKKEKKKFLYSMRN